MPKPLKAGAAIPISAMIGVIITLFSYTALSQYGDVPGVLLPAMCVIMSILVYLFISGYESNPNTAKTKQQRQK